jgi:hypothetical protein
MEGTHHRSTGTDSTGRTMRGKEQTQRRPFNINKEHFRSRAR